MNHVFHALLSCPDPQTQLSFPVLLEIKGSNGKKVSAVLGFPPGFFHPHRGNKAEGLGQQQELFRQINYLVN